MPVKYHVHTHQAPPRFRVEGKLGIVDWREDCSSCHNCVKKGCVYGLYRDETDALHKELGYLDYIYQCKGCLTCIQNCTKNILTRVVNPEYERLGDAYFAPDIILTTWYQAETGNIPVSGCGYGGPFSGPGFDSMWTDMSEIVRPTRDGIHGREYINTGVDIGRKLHHLTFKDGQPVEKSPPLIQSPLPLMLDAVPAHWHRGQVSNAFVKAAEKAGLFAIVRAQHASGQPESAKRHIVPLLESANPEGAAAFSDAPMVILPDSSGTVKAIEALKKQDSRRIVAVRIQATPGVAKRALELTHDGVEVINLVFDKHGKETGTPTPRHMRDAIREVHGALTKDGTRDLVTLMTSGGIALAEHMAKAIICGADLVAADVPFVVAMECRLCGECERGEKCQIDLDAIDVAYATQRVVNLIAAWHNQLIEMLGAMGMREVRRLRGERGRCMFFEDLERDAFGRIFGKRKDLTHQAATA